MNVVFKVKQRRAEEKFKQRKIYRRLNKDKLKNKLNVENKQTEWYKKLLN